MPNKSKICNLKSEILTYFCRPFTNSGDGALLSVTKSDLEI
jgi:hypothetical protein